MASVALVTGAGRPFGERVAARLSAESSIGRIIAVDTVPPRTAPAGRVEFVRADIGHPLIGQVLDQAGVDTVVHIAPRDGAPAALTTLLAACERSRSLTRLVVQSSIAVYPAGASAPAVRTENEPVDDAAEALVRAFARHRRDVTVSVLRLADLVGRGFDSAAMRRLSGAVVACEFGYDPRLQLLHVDDALDVVAQACVERHPGAVNVAGSGVLTLAQVARRIGRLRIAGIGRIGLRPTSPTSFGRVVDTSRLATRYGVTPRFSTAEALDAAIVTGRVRARVPALALGVITAAERVLT